MHGKAVGYVLLKDVLLNYIVESSSILKQDVAACSVCSLRPPNSMHGRGERLSGEHLHLCHLSSLGCFYRVKIVLKTLSKHTTVNQMVKN